MTQPDGTDGVAERRGGRLRGWLRRLRPTRAQAFRALERFGYHLTPVNFYQPIPDTRSLRGDIWTKRSELPGIDMRPDAQLALLERLTSEFKKDYDVLPRTAEAAAGGYHLDNERFGPVDAEILYAMLRHLAPRRFVEIGSGYSTLLAAKALADARRGGGEKAELVTVDPFPNPAFTSQEVLQSIAGDAVKCTVVRKQVQDVPLADLTSLEAGDVLFIDSSHVMAIGSDVQFEFLEVIPRLRKGVVVHVHDIFLPVEYPKHWVFDYHLFWTEQYVLQAFLTHNRAFEVLWAGRYMHTYHPEALARAFASYDPAVVEPGSFWMRRVE